MGDVDADALLAQALWEAEQAEFDEHGFEGGEHSDDSDYQGGRPHKRKKQQQRPARTKQPRKSAGAAAVVGKLPSGSNTIFAKHGSSIADHTAIAPQPARAAECKGHVALGVQQQQIHQQLTTPNSGNAQILASAAAEAAAQVTIATAHIHKQHQNWPSNQESCLDQQEPEPSARRRRKDCGQKREAGRSWTAAEEAAFLAGLELHGRDWKAVADAISTRDSRQVASHAQKHFVKLCLAGKPLPTKVAESGKGYTLSGKLLDPNSASAQAYGFKPELLQRLEGAGLATALEGMLPTVIANVDAAQRDQVDTPLSALAPHKRSKPNCTRARSSGSGVAGTAGTVVSNRHRSVSAAAGVDASDADSGQAQQLAAALAVPPPVLAPSEKARLAAAEASTATAATAAAAAGTVSANEAGGTITATTEAALTPADARVRAGNTAANAPFQKQWTGHVGTAVNAAMAKAADVAAGVPVGDASMPTGLPCRTDTAAASTLAAGGAAAMTNSSPAGTEPCLPDDGHVTEYARSRPKRGCAGQRVLQLGATSESLELLACRDFLGPVGSGLPSAQPYSVEVEMQVMLVMEVHAHCSSYEVIGLLGGTWDSSARLMRVTAAYPCSRAAGSDARTSVELAPEAEVEAREAMAAAGQRCVGWYHSHPVFEPSPSLKDCENQRNYQALTRDTNTASAAAGLEPFVGFILSPYDLSLPRPHTKISAFMVQQKGIQLMPYNVRYGMVGTSAVPGPAMRTVLQSLLSSLVFDVGRTDYTATWRAFTALGGPTGMAPLGPPMSKLDKLLAGLRWQAMYIGDKLALESWLQQLCEDLQDIWNLPLAALKDKLGEQL